MEILGKEVPRQIYHESGWIDPEKTKEMFDLFRQANEVADRIQENQVAWSAAEGEEKDELFKKAQKLGAEFSNLLKKIDKAEVQNTPLVNRVKNAI